MVLARATWWRGRVRWTTTTALRGVQHDGICNFVGLVNDGGTPAGDAVAPPRTAAALPRRGARLPRTPLFLPQQLLPHMPSCRAAPSGSHLLITAAGDTCCAGTYASSPFSLLSLFSLLFSLLPTCLLQYLLPCTSYYSHSSTHIHGIALLMDGRWRGSHALLPALIFLPPTGTGMGILSGRFCMSWSRILCIALLTSPPPWWAGAAGVVARIACGLQTLSNKWNCLCPA